MYCVYHKDKTFCFSGVAPEQAPAIEYLRVEITPANLIQKIGNNKELWVLSSDPPAAFSDFCGLFAEVAAAGGVVRNRAEEVLMIYRKGWWDLPKGHIESGESPATAAFREIMEETGLDGLTGGELLCRTMHFYDDFGPWEMKTTWWYKAEYPGTESPVPQKEEGIERVEWLSGGRLAEAMDSAYPTVREVMGMLARKG